MPVLAQRFDAAEAGMKMRSLLFVPGDRPERMRKAMDSAADVVLLDLEDSVTPAQKTVARDAIAEFLGGETGEKSVFVRVNPLDSGAWLRRDLECIAGHPPDGLILPKAAGQAAIERFDTVLETFGLGGLPILPIATETAASVFELGSYRAVASRLLGLTWGAEDLSAAIGATAPREPNGDFTAPYVTVRSLALFAAHAAGVRAIETVYPDFRDEEGLMRIATRAARDGFSGMMAIHPAQLEIINNAFEPSAEALAHARAVVDAFAAIPGAGALSLDGQMIDAPHLKLAQRLLAGR